MENNQVNQPTGKTKKVVLISLGTLVFGALAFFGIKKITSPKKENEDEKDSNETDTLDTKTSVQNPAGRVPRTSVPAPDTNAPFPLSVGSKGNNVRRLQQSLIGAFGKAALPKFGADGYFGNELATALRKNGYGVPLQEAEYKKITQAPATKALKPFDPGSVAFGLYNAIVAKDYNSAMTLLKAIGNTGNYTLVSAPFKQYFINGVRQTLVNAMLSTFNEKSQKESTKKVFMDIGLKYNEGADKWALSGKLY